MNPNEWSRFLFQKNLFLKHRETFIDSGGQRMTKRMKCETV